MSQNTGLDFSQISDDQLVELFRALCAEAAQRGNHVEAAVRAAGLDEAERARVAREAAERAAEQLRREEAERIAREAAEQVRRQATQEQVQKAADEQAKIWGKQKMLGRAVQQLFGEGASLTVWNKNGDKRVYIDAERSISRKHSETLVRVEYYETGNSYNPPKTLKISGSRATGTDEEKALVKLLVERACAHWNTLPKMDCDAAAKAEVPALGVQEEVDKWRAYGKARQEREAAAAEVARRKSFTHAGGNPVVLLKTGPDGTRYVVTCSVGLVNARACEIYRASLNSDGSANYSYLKMTNQYNSLPTELAVLFSAEELESLRGTGGSELKPLDYETIARFLGAEAGVENV
jgi:hypothetical protein